MRIADSAEAELKARKAGAQRDWRAKQEKAAKVDTVGAARSRVYYAERKQEWTHWNLKRYGLTPEDWQEMYERQEGRCALCGEMPSKALCVDHDHSTDEVRALLCNSCNVRLGAVEDLAFRSAAIEYLGGF